LIEENHFSSLQMLHDRRTDLTSTQATVAAPFKVNARLPAVTLHYRSIIGMEEVLPAHIESGSKVAHIHQPAFGKHLSQIRIECLIDHAAIDDRSLAATLRRLHAVEPDQH